jgi:hypothetical protein
LIPAAAPGGRRPRKTEMRAAMNAILYLREPAVANPHLGGLHHQYVRI